MKLFSCFVGIALSCAACTDPGSSVFVTSACSIDVPAKGAVIKAGSAFSVGGWAFDNKSAVIPKEIKIQFVPVGRTFVKVAEAKRGAQRPDVAKAFNNPAAVAAGFDAMIAADLLPAGHYDLSVLQTTSSGALLLCGYDHSIQIK